jgi:hypothetical protein
LRRGRREAVYRAVMLEREGIINIWLVFEVFEIVMNFIRITCALYVDLIEILNSQL